MDKTRIRLCRINWRWKYWLGILSRSHFVRFL